MSCNRPEVFTVLVVLCSCIGCSRSQSGSATYDLSWTSSSADAVPGIDKGSVHIMTLKSAARPLTFAVWTDMDVGSSVGSEGKGFYELTQQGSDGSRLEIRYESPDGEAGTMTIEGVDHDLSDGALFLISAAGEELRVLQLEYDMDEFPTDSSALKTLAEDDQAILEFFTSGNQSED